MLNCSQGQIASRQNDTFVPVVSRLSGHYSRWPCGVGGVNPSLYLYFNCFIVFL